MTTRTRLLAAIVIVLGALATLVWTLSKRDRPGNPAVVTSTENPHARPSVPDSTPARPLAQPTAQQSAEPAPQASPGSPESSPQLSPGGQPSPDAPDATLLIPV